MEKNCVACHIRAVCHLRIEVDYTLRANPQYFDRPIRTEDSGHLGIFEAVAKKCLKYKPIGERNGTIKKS